MTDFSISLYTSYMRPDLPPGTPCSSLSDEEPFIGNREPQSDSSSAPPSQVDTTDDVESENGPTRESPDEASSVTSSQTLVGQTMTSSPPNEHHTNQVPPNDQTASSVINQMHAVIDQTTLTLTSTATGLYETLLDSRDQLESTRTALDQTLEYLVGYTDRFPHVNLVKRIVEQSVGLQQQIEIIDSRRERLETRLGQSNPTLSAQVFTHRPDTDGHDSHSAAGHNSHSAAGHDSHSAAGASSTSTLL